MIQTKSIHIILGAGGAIGNVLANDLISRNEKVKLVSRSGMMLPGAESVKVDLTDAKSVKGVLEESSTVYLLAGLPYRLSIWKGQWPKIMRNVVDGCIAQKARLIFFDNAYMYGKVVGSMTEESPVNPCSRKGEVRAQIADKLMSEVKKGNITALIARAADFYGPYSEKSSVPYILVFSRLAKGKKAQWLANAGVKHSYTYTGDCGKALCLLANTDDAFNQIWHLPTAAPALTGKEFVEMAALKLGVKPRYMALRKWMAALGGIFDRQISEIYEMLYQNEFEYIFDSSKFEKRFNFKPTPYERGIEETIQHSRQRGLL